MKKRILIIELILIIILSIFLSILIYQIEPSYESKVKPIVKGSLDVRMFKYAKEAFPTNVDYQIAGVTSLKLSLTDLESFYDDDLKVFIDAGCNFDDTFIEMDLNTKEYSYIYNCTNVE